PSTIRLAEVCRNRTDRSTIGRPAGFEVPDGHQPACTSVVIITYCVRQICSVIRGRKKRPSAISSQLLHWGVPAVKADGWRSHRSRRLSALSFQLQHWCVPAEG